MISTVVISHDTTGVLTLDQLRASASQVAMPERPSSTAAPARMLSPP